MASYRADLLDHLHTPPPHRYSAVSVQQILRADRAAFLLMSERMTSMKRGATNQLRMDLALLTILSQPAFHVLPLSGATQSKAVAPTKGASTRKRSRSRQRQPKGMGKSGPKGRKGKSRGPSIPAGLVGKALETAQKKRLRWAFNLPIGCSSCKPGETCATGIHLCAEPGCFKPHSLQDHR